MDRFAKVIVVIVIFFALALGGLYYVLSRAAKTLQQAGQLVARKEEVLDLGTVVQRVQSLSRLETVSMRVMNVTRIEQSYGVLPQGVAGDAISFMAIGDVVAGVDMSRITEKNIRQDTDGTVVIVLPAAEVFSARLDSGASRVIDRDTGVFRKGDPQLETRVRQRAERAILDQAVREGIVRTAASNAEQKLADFLHSLRIDKVRFEKVMVPGRN